MKLRIALDLFGGDHAPGAVVEGARLALAKADQTADPPFEIVFVGNKAALEARLDVPVPEGCEIVDIPSQRLDEGDFSTLGTDPNSAIRTALRLHSAGNVEAVISAGPTGAQVKASLEELEKCHGITRPAIGTLLPTTKGQVYLLDVGASLTAGPHHLVQFAVMGHVYVTELLGLEKPSLAVLNVAHEKMFGDRTAIEAHRLLSESGFNFVGFVEGRDIPTGIADVVVTNGFVGNTLLKFMEGLPVLFKPYCSTEVWTNIQQQFDYQTYGGEPLMGVKGLSIVCHGASSEQAIAAAIKRAVKLSQIRLYERLETFLVNKFPSYFSQVKYLRSFRRSFRWFSDQSEPEN